MQQEFDYEDLRRVAVKISGEASGMLRDLACTSEKLGEQISGETVRIDIIAEDYIVSGLRTELGNDIRIVTEEKGVIGRGNLTAIVDPLDGSKNYLNCIPWASVSIAFVPSNKSLRDVVAGAVSPIFYGEPISFARGHGCRLGHSSVKKREPPERFIYVYIEHPDAAHSIAKIIGELGRGYKIRSLGSAALEISYVGLGRGTAFIDLRSKLRNVDLAAGLGVVLECGGDLIDGEGRPIDTPVDRIYRAGTVIAAPDKNILKNIYGALS